MASHRWWTSACTFWASFSITPQLVSGGTMPMPRKLRLLSPRIVPGMASVAVTMMWLSEPGRRCLLMIRQWLEPTTRAAITYSSWR